MFGRFMAATIDEAICENRNLGLARNGAPATISPYLIRQQLESHIGARVDVLGFANAFEI